MLWIKALHIIFMVTWFAGLFYLPRLFVYHAMSEDSATRDQFKIMERKLYFGITTPGGILTIGSGLGCGLGTVSAATASGWLARSPWWLYSWGTTCGADRWSSSLPRGPTGMGTCFIAGSTSFPF